LISPDFLSGDQMKIQWKALPGDSSISSHADSDKAYLQLLIEHSPIAIVILNSSHQAKHCNPIFERMFGYTRAEIVDRNFDELIAFGETLDEARRCTRSVLHGEKTNMVTRRRRKDGVWIDVDIHGIPLIVDGVLRGVYGLYVDITERTRAESSLRQLSLELMHLQEKEKRRIARELHDATSQELALLSMRLGQLQRKLPPQDLELLELVNNIRDLTRQCTQKIRTASYLLHPPLLQEAGLVPAISWLAEGFAERTGIRVNVKISSKLGRLAEQRDSSFHQQRRRHSALAPARDHRTQRHRPRSPSHAREGRPPAASRRRRHRRHAGAPAGTRRSSPCAFGEWRHGRGRMPARGGARQCLNSESWSPMIIP